MRQIYLRHIRRGKRKVHNLKNELRDAKEAFAVLKLKLDTLGDESESIIIKRLFSQIGATGSADKRSRLEMEAARQDKYSELKCVIRRGAKFRIPAFRKHQGRPNLSTPDIAALLLAMIWEDLTGEWPGRTSKASKVYPYGYVEAGRFRELCALLFGYVFAGSRKPDASIRAVLTGEATGNKAKIISLLLRFGRG
jgi:hypothetical protein